MDSSRTSEPLPGKCIVIWQGPSSARACVVVDERGHGIPVGRLR